MVFKRKEMMNKAGTERQQEKERRRKQAEKNSRKKNLVTYSLVYLFIDSFIYLFESQVFFCWSWGTVHLINVM